MVIDSRASPRIEGEHLEDDPGPAVAWLLAGGAVDNIVLIGSLALVVLTVVAGTALRNFRWPRLSKLVSPERLEEMEALLKQERAILDGLLVLRLLASISLLLSMIGPAGVSSSPAGFLGELALALVVFLGGVYGVVRGVVRSMPERALVWTIKLAWLAARAMGPIVWVMDGIGRVVSRAFGLNVTPDEQEEAVEEILDAVSEGERDGAIDDDEREMIENIIEVRDQAVSQVMTPRTSVLGLPVETPLADAVSKVVENGLSRIPVYEDTIDNIKGILYAKDLLVYWAGRNGTEPPTAGHIMRPAHFIPETKNTSDLLEELRRDKVHMAIVVDEYGGTAGLVTIEDIIEEIVGEIEDEHDRPEDGEPTLKMLNERTAEMSALIHIDDVNEALNIELPESDGYDTIGGFLFERMGRVPGAGEQCEFQNVQFEIMDADERRIHFVQVTVEN